MAAKERTVDLIANAFDLNQRRKYSVKIDGKSIIDLYFKPITRSDRKVAMAAAGTEDALLISTQMLCQCAELEDGSKAFAMADVPKIHRQWPEKVLNEIELFLFELAGESPEAFEEAKND